jgi:hypothetical protein
LIKEKEGWVMPKKLLLLALLAVALLSGSAVWADGDLYVVGGGGLPVGTKITSLPACGLTINSPGFYFLGGNQSYSGSANAITILADNVTFDLRGFSLTGPLSAPYSSGPHGIYMSGRLPISSV